jgi:hypothetical protein
MNLFIELRDGVPYGHPVVEDNFKEVYPDIDTQNLPSNFAKFIRTPPPSNVGMFNVEESTYQIVDGVVTDVWTIRPLEGEQYETRLSMFRASITQFVEDEKIITQGKIAGITDPAIKAAWENYLTQLNSWVLTTISENFNDLGIPARPIE